ncbi:excinuclease ABC subunit UvrA [Rothia sp. AR01]|uniref:UvrABC system protein A n=2 Tax=Rothia santali TaxID=2949643 RepID=A0A9X2HF35_9MICC|nr:excinuclease ABC subunit UvrA [Rothia santali]MCP3426109.1 excinuclease ABC subunit UvrA [Rothia santali]
MKDSADSTTQTTPPMDPMDPVVSATLAAPGTQAPPADPSGHAPGTGHIRAADAHLHNLRHVSLEFPRGALVAFTGVSGSGKSSLAFGTLHGEVQRRYLESIAPFARRLLGDAMDPCVGSVTGMPPSVALEQRTSAGGARSTVGTVTTLSNAVRLLYSRAGEHPADVLSRGSALHGGRLTSDAFSPNTPEGMCPACHGAGVLREPTEASMVPDPSLSIAEGAIAAWPGAWLGKNFRDILRTLGIDLYVPWRELPEDTREWILFTDEQPVVTVVPEREAGRIQRNYQGKWTSVARYLRRTADESKTERSRRRALRHLQTRRCPECEGHRLTRDALRVTYLGEPIHRLGERAAEDLLERLAGREDRLPGGGGTPEEEAERLLLESILPVLRAVVGLGLGHLSLDRRAQSLSSGELQRLRLAAQLRAGLFGVAYVLDEPSAGLHPSEKGVLRDLFRRFLEEGNSVLLVEHDMDLVAQADWVVDVGPGAGVEGGRVLHSGPVEGLLDHAESATARSLRAPAPELRTAEETREPSGRLRLTGIRARTLHDVDLDLPLGCLTAVAGVSGAGKSTLVTHVLGGVLGERVRTALADDPEPAETGADADADALDPAEDAAPVVASVEGAEAVDRLVRITQKPIGRSPRSCLATYTGLFDRVRRLFAATPLARERGWGIGRFSYNVAEGRCPTCAGEGRIEVELVFLPGSYAVCPDCHGARYAPETLEVAWNGHDVAQILQLSVRAAREVFADDAGVSRALEALDAIGLGYLTLGQPATELSGGEAQRIKLATELQRAPRGHTVYLLDEPTVGLHPADVELLVAELNRLTDQGNTVVAVEHDLRVIAQADHVVDLGPGAGERGGRIVARGAPAEVAADPASATGRCLARLAERPAAGGAAPERSGPDGSGPDGVVPDPTEPAGNIPTAPDRSGA